MDKDEVLNQMVIMYHLFYLSLIQTMSNVYGECWTGWYIFQNREMIEHQIKLIKGIKQQC